VSAIHERPVQRYSLVFGFGAEGQGFVVVVDFYLTFCFLVVKVEDGRHHFCSAELRWQVIEYMWMLKRKGARTDPYGTPFLKHRNLHRLPLPLVRVKLRLPYMSMIMWTMCLSGSNRSCFQARPRCHS